MAYEQLYEQHPDLLEEWRHHGQPKVVLKTEDEESLLVTAWHNQLLIITKQEIKEFQ